MPPDNSITGLQIATFVIAVVGAMLAVASLAWQAYTFRMSGPRVKVALVIGAVMGGHIAYNEARPGWRKTFNDFQGHPVMPFVGIKVVNIGRLPITVLSIRGMLDTGQKFGPIGGGDLGKGLPYRLDSHDEEVWGIPVPDVIAAISAVRTSANPKILSGRVELSGGRGLTTTEQIDVNEFMQFFAA
jgi:hypothetical protein